MVIARNTSSKLISSPTVIAASSVGSTINSAGFTRFVNSPDNAYMIRSTTQNPLDHVEQAAANDDASHSVDTNRPRDAEAFNPRVVMGGIHFIRGWMKGRLNSRDIKYIQHPVVCNCCTVLCSQIHSRCGFTQRTESGSNYLFTGNRFC